MMEDKDLRKVYPISWVTESSCFNDFMERALSESESDLLIADFASGEHDRVPSFFTRALPRLMEQKTYPQRRTVVYCTDIHALRLDSLLGKLEEEELLSQVRVVHAALETMETSANLRPVCVEFIDDHPDDGNWLDDFLIGEQCFPPECFDIGILNNDIVGYMHEYYKEYSDARKGLWKVRKLVRPNGMLIVTMPCSLYVIDNISVLEKVGFKYIEGIDINLSTSNVNLLHRKTEPTTMSRLGHYTFLLFMAV